MKVIITSFGSSGDFNPCLGLGRALACRGVEVFFLSNPYYEQKITEAGLRFVPAGDYFDVFKEIADNPDYLHARKGPVAVWKMVVKTVPVMYEAMTALIRKESPDMVACHLLEYGSMIAAIDRSIPYATLSPTPMGWFYKPTPAYANFTPLPRWFRAMQARTGRRIINAALKYSLAPYCRKHNIPQPFENIAAVYEKARLNLGLWSALFRPPADTDPPHSAICGFVRDEHIRDWPKVPKAIRRLFDQPNPPVVAGLGSTASLHGAAIYQHTAIACRSLGWPCLLIGKDLAPLADPKHHILTVDFAPYGWVFPRAGLVIHHGGVNTTAETLRAGVPGLVFPHGYDQFDNAIRTQQMGVADRLKPRQAGGMIFLAAIRTILADDRMLNRAQAFAARLRAEPDGGTVAAKTIINAVKIG